MISIATPFRHDYNSLDFARKCLMQSNNKDGSIPLHYIRHDLKASHHMDEYVIPVRPK